MDVTKAIKRLMIQKDLTATQLAEKVGMSQSNLSQKMKNESYSVADLIKIADATGVQLEVNFLMEDGTKI